MNEEQFIKKYKEAVSQEQLEAPDDVWCRLSSQLDADHIKREQDNEQWQDELIDDVWNSISNELDIDDVWGGISKELDHDRFRLVPWLRRWAIAAAILLPMGIGLLFYLVSNDREGMQVYAPDLIDTLQNQVEEQQFIYKKDRSVISDTLGNSLQLLNREQQKESNEHENAASEQTYLTETSRYSIVETLDKWEESDKYMYFALVAREEPVLYSIFPEVTPRLKLDDNEKMDGYFDRYRFDLLPPPDQKDMLAIMRKDSRWTIGVVTSIKNTYLVNHKTKEGFETDQFSRNKMVILPDFGLNVKYALNKKFILDSNLFLFSSTEQSYNDYIYGEFTNMKIRLNYQMGEFALKHNAKNSIFSSDKVIRRNTAGVYLAYLNSASEKAGHKDELVKSKYSTFDYGLMLGQEFEFKSTGPIKITAGLTAKYGLPNIYKGNDKVPAHFNRTHSASVEFRIGIGYRIGAKRGVDHYLGCVFDDK